MPIAPDNLKAAAPRKTAVATGDPTAVFLGSQRHQNQ
jgi:hypothetical protein